MSVIKLHTANERLIFDSKPVITSGNIDIVSISVTLCRNWREVGETADIWAVFYRDESEKLKRKLVDGSCMIPNEMLIDRGFFYIGIYAENANSERVKTSNIVEYEVRQGTATTAETKSRIVANAQAEYLTDLANSLETATGEDYAGKTWEELNEEVQSMNDHEVSIDLSEYVKHDEMPEIDVDDIVTRAAGTEPTYSFEADKDPVYWVDNSKIDIDGSLASSSYPTCVSPEIYLGADLYYKITGNCYEDEIYQYGVGGFVEKTSISADGLFKVHKDAQCIRLVVPKFNNVGEEIDLNETVEYFCNTCKLYICDRYKLKDNVELPDNIEIPNVPTKVSELENDKGFITLNDLPEVETPEVSNITPEQTTFFEFVPANNLLDASTKQVGLLNNDGKIYTGGSYDNYRYFEQYIPVDVGDEISLQYTYNGIRFNYSVTNNMANFARVVAYDTNKQILKTLGAVTNPTNKVYAYTVPETVAYIRITISSSSDGWTDISVVKNTSVVLPYEEYGTNSKAQLKAEYIPEKKNKVIAFLPDEIVCATGRTIEIYNNQICPIAEKYHFRWVCDIGKALKRKFSITGTEELLGDYDLILEIYDDTETCLYSKTSTLKIVTGTIADNVSICPIGDSLTNGKYWLNEVRTLSDNKVSYVGTRGNTEGVKHEGRSGFTSKGYLTAQDYGFENEGVHPFWNGSKFSWSYYKTNSGINPDAVQIFLGTNDLFGNTTAETFSENIKTMVDDIRSTDANIPLFIVMTILTGNQNGLGKQQSTDGFASYKGKYKYALDCKFIKAMELLYDTLKDYENLYFVPLTECHDNEYNFGAVETAVNPRAIQKEFMPNEGIHPQQQGYEQMADVMYSVYCRAFTS